MNVNEVLERFRMADYHYPDVIWHDIRSAKLKQKLTAELMNITADEFKTLLLSNLFLPQECFQTSRQHDINRKRI